MRQLPAFPHRGVSAARRPPALPLLTALSLLTTAPLSPAGDARFFRIIGPAATTLTAISPDGYVTWTNPVANVTCIVQTALTLAGPSNWVDYVQVPVSNCVVTHRLYDPNPPAGMMLIPAGSFTMGNTFSGDGYSAELPLHTVSLSAFYMDQYEVTKALWDEVKAWHGGNGYRYDNAGSGKAGNHPVQTVNWYDALKWCNARSQKEGLTPCYYTDAGLTNLYKTTQIVPRVNGEADGYRLPTEAEWEKAARGGLRGRRFPWNDTDEITHSRANYSVWVYDDTNYYDYDKSPTAGYHPTFKDEVVPYTSPAGYFGANGYGLYDMAGNVWEWCWDWHGSYSTGSQTDPLGPSSGTVRVLRGGSWNSYAYSARCAYRNYYYPGYAYNVYGFRCVRRRYTENDSQ